MSLSTLSERSLDQNNSIIMNINNPNSAASVNDHFFEGAEKLLEILFDNQHEGTKSLRQIPYGNLVAMLNLAHCRILHSRSNECMDSYVLSESSMFISDSRIILKTCGTTRLLHVIEQILHLAKTFCNLKVHSVFYSRKNFLHPEKQPFPHKSFESEIDYLDNYFVDGRAYCMGPVKKDQWFLYTAVTPDVVQTNPDHTLEILMTQMPESVLALFSRSACKDALHCRERSGIANVLPSNAVVHDELFDPCGYSLNALHPKTDQYITIHVTPEPEFSYVSFETNQHSFSLCQQILRVISIFKPKKFLLTVFTNEQSKQGKKVQKKLWDREISGYRRSNLQFLLLQTEGLVYAQYERSNDQLDEMGIEQCSTTDDSSGDSDGDSDNSNDSDTDDHGDDDNRENVIHKKLKFL